MHTFGKPFRSCLVSIFPQELINLVFVNNVSKPINHKTRNKPCLRAHFTVQYLLDIDGPLHVTCYMLSNFSKFSNRVQI
ncbi:hypothetical protein PI172_0430 [Prevotella intermedia]|uniref:Uncharacterized protein n=1 Tax=Prevotella intermedia TaxID=28131 RepID=A0AAD1BH79_PREIN|nr:hypothetical protein PI172_0430 [Prevotella intermedia]